MRHTGGQDCEQGAESDREWEHTQRQEEGERFKVISNSELSEPFMGTRHSEGCKRASILGLSPK